MPFVSGGIRFFLYIYHSISWVDFAATEMADIPVVDMK